MKKPWTNKEESHSSIVDAILVDWKIQWLKLRRTTQRAHSCQEWLHWKGKIFKTKMKIWMRMGNDVGTDEERSLYYKFKTKDTKP